MPQRGGTQVGGRSTAVARYMRSGNVAARWMPRIVGNGSRVPKRALGEKPRLGDEILAARGWVDNRTVAVVGREATRSE
jgi:hypothetical protein